MRVTIIAAQSEATAAYEVAQHAVQLGANVHSSLGGPPEPSKEQQRAIDLWQLAHDLRGCSLWQNKQVEAAAVALDAEACKIAAAGGFEYEDVMRFVE